MAEGLLCHSLLKVTTKVDNGLKVAQRVEDRVTLLPLELAGCPVVVLIDCVVTSTPQSGPATHPHWRPRLLFVLDRLGLCRCFWQPSTELLKM